MTLTESPTDAAQRARTATERSVEIWKQSVKTIHGRAGLLSGLPTIDLTRPVKRYFEYVQKAVDLELELATTWAEMMMSLVGVLREEAEKVSVLVWEETENVADPARGRAERVEQGTQAQAEREPDSWARQVEREQHARQAREGVRRRYQGLSKAELSDRLAERELPGTGTVRQLVERLVSADSA